MIKYEVTYTDTFGGEANYCWVRRHEIQAKTMAGAIRKAKALVGLTGIPCRKTDFGNEVHLNPVNCNTVLFVVEMYQ